MKKSSWFKLLYYWSYLRVPNGSGLTIPFLIGAERKSSNHNDHFSIRNLIDELVHSHEIRYEISIRQCNTIGTLVCSLDELVDDEKSDAMNIGNLYLFANELSELSTVEALSEYLAINFDEFIEKDQYSIERGKWTHFSIDDMIIIQKALNSNTQHKI